MSAESSRAVVITGASSGIGRACAERLAREGFRVFGTYLPQEGAAALDGMSAVVPIPLDVTDSDSIARAAEQVSAECESGLWGLVNNAGVDIPGPLEFLPLERLREQLEVNVIGPIAVTQAFLPLIRKGRGRIVMIGSIDGKAVTPFQGGYGASKHAIEALTDALRMELSAWDIPVSVVEPGDIATPIWEKSLALADRMLGELPEKAHDLYGTQMTAARATAVKMSSKAASPETVVRAVHHALTARRPKTRYLVGMDARIRLALEILPSRWVDRLIMGFIARGGK